MQHLSSKAIIFSGASGAGKTTLAQYLLKNNTQLQFSVSACTRTRRPHEIDGEDYHFLSQEEFEASIARNEFLEWEEVYPGHYYGTLQREIDKIWAAGKVVLFDVDVQGGLKLKKQLEHQALAIFVQAPAPTMLVERLIKRGENSENIAMRTNKVAQEMILAQRFDVVLVNGDLEQSFRRVQRLVDSFVGKPSA